jgi:tetratricopeptide (TPR) repeat protein
MQRETTLSRWCGWVVEAGWLIALTLVPIYFNLYSARHFEPDKITALRSIVLVMAAAALIRACERLSAGVADAPAPTATVPPLWRRFVAFPLALPTLFYVVVFLLTTLTSVVPATSFWGSYQRLQGTYTHLSYVLLFVLIVTHLRSRAQLERLISVTLAAAVVVGGYGIIQHQQLDPLPWRGDVITRVASTMGNSIFVAAYMIMVVPLALYRFVGGLAAAREAPAAATPRNDWLWALTRLLLVSGGLLLILAMLIFGATVRVADLRYWWIFPGAIMVATSLWWLLTCPIDRAGRLPILPAALSAAFLLLFGLMFAFSAAGGSSVQQFGPDPALGPWWLYLLLSVAAIGGGHALALTLPRRTAEASRLALQIDAWAAAIVALLLLTAIFFTQSRGPWLGMGAGLFVFVSLLLWQGLRRARAAGAAVQVGRLRAALGAWVALAVVLGGFLIAFNLSQAPFFERLRDVPYIGRMGRLLEVNSGTGLVRRLIWAGDAYGGGAVGLITADPVRAVVGWGPESMFVAFNPFYPPALSSVEARGASPDRSHQSLLDELVTRGLLGLTSYIFLIGSFAALSWRLIRRSDEWCWQVFFIATFSAVTAHVVEGLVGIPVVSTLMLLWVLLAVTVVGGGLAGQYALTLFPHPAAPPELEPVQAAAPPQRKSGAKGGRNATARGSAARTAPATRATRRGNLSGAAIGVYSLVIIGVLGLVWWFNLQPVYADMRFQQGQGVSEAAGYDLNRLVTATDDFLDTIRSNPREDFYYLNLGRTMMSIADALRLQGFELGSADQGVDVRDLLRLDGTDQIVLFLERTPPNRLMSYAEAVLLRAQQLNPRNKDHYANLGRLNSYWATWDDNPERLRTALRWYEQVAPIAPQDVTLINERAGVLVQLGDYASRIGDAQAAQDAYAQAEELLDHSALLDPRYADTFVRLGDLYRVRDTDLERATEQYVRAIGLSAIGVANAAERMAEGLAARPDLIGQLRSAFVQEAERAESILAAAETQPERQYDLPTLRDRAALLHTIAGLMAVRSGDVPGSVDAYRRAVELLPGNSNYSRNFTLVLSDTGRYDEAIAEQRRLISTIGAAPNRQRDLEAATQLIQIVEQARQ